MGLVIKIPMFMLRKSSNIYILKYNKVDDVKCDITLLFLLLLTIVLYYNNNGDK